MSVTVQTAPGVPTPNDQYRLITRVINYPVVSSAWTTATTYYSSAKEKSPLVRYATGVVESNLEKGTKLVEPVLKNELVKKYAEPILSKVDDIGCKQLDKMERLSDQYSSSKQLIEQKVSAITNDLKATSTTVVDYGKQTLEQKVVPTVDGYLKNSVLSLPINVALDVTEIVANVILPPVKGEKTEKPSTECGPVVRAGNLTKKLQNRAFAKLKQTQLTLRNPEQISAMKFTVDLIQYAATQLDSTAKASQQLVGQVIHKSVVLGTTVVSVAVNQQQKSVAEIKEQVSFLSGEALKALTYAIDTLSKNAPASVTTLSKSTFETLKQKTAILSTQLATVKDYTQFAAVAKKSAEKLQEATFLLSSYAATAAETYLPPNVVASINRLLETSLDLLSTVLPVKNYLLKQEPAQ